MKDSQFFSNAATGIGEIDHLIGGDGRERSGVVVWLERAWCQ